jgi:hypothetical protein
MKTKQRFLQLKPRLELATDEELFTELMKRITKKHPSICYFIDQVNNYRQWDIHASSSPSLIVADKLN